MKALIIGSTGLVGSSVIQLLIGDSECDFIISVSRKKNASHPKILEKIMQLDRLDDLKMDLQNQFGKGDIAICCLGTTIKIAGSQNAFRQVDFEYVVKFAQVCKTLGIEKFGVISAAGASASSNIFYSKVKGEMEKALIDLNFQNLVMARPGLLLGDRKEFRLGEKIFSAISPMMNFMLIGSLEKYRSVHADQVSKSIVNCLKNTNQKVKYLEGFDLSYP